jgi:ribonuclease HI
VTVVDIWIDGSGFNEGKSRFAVICRDGRQKVVELACNQTIDDMRYHSMVYAIEYLASDGDTIFTDSPLMVSRGSQLLNGKNVKIKRISREENKATRLIYRL